MFKTAALDSVANEYVDKNIGSGTPGTRLEAADRNIIQDEMVAVVEESGQTLDPAGTDRTQVSKSIPKSIDDVTDLKAYSGSLLNGMRFDLLGHNTIGIGSQPLVWDSSSTETENDGTIFKIASIVTGRYKSFNTDRISFGQFGPIKDGVTAEDDIFLSFLQEVHDKKSFGMIPAGNYAIQFVENRTLTNDVKIICHPEARFIGLPTKQVFAGSNQTELTVTIWTKGTSFLLTYITGGVETTLTEGTEFTVAGQVINLLGGSAPHGALAPGDSIRVSDSKGMFQIGANSIDGSRFGWEGGYFDSSERGYQENDGSGTAMTLYNFEQCHFSRSKFYGSVDYEVARATGVSDSGLTTISCSNVDITKNHFQGFADLGIYATGGAGGASDNGYGVVIHSNRFLKCAGGASIKRSSQGGSITNNLFEYCRTGASIVPTGGTSGGRGSVSNNQFLFTGRAAVDARGSGGIIVNDNLIIDWGKKLDGVTPIGSPAAAIEFLGIQEGKISGNLIKNATWVPDGNMIGIQIGKDVDATGTDSSHCVVSGNTIQTADIGYDENNTGIGNVWSNNDMINVSTPVSVLSARKWDYHTSNIKHEGIGTVEFTGLFTPTVVFAGATPTINYTTQYGKYIRQGNLCKVFVRTTFSYSGAVSANQFRIDGMPYTSNSESNQDSFGSLGRTDTPFTLPAGVYQVVPTTPPGATYVRLDCLKSGAVPVQVTTDDIAASTSFRIEFVMEYEVEPEAQN